MAGTSVGVIQLPLARVLGRSAMRLSHSKRWTRIFLVASLLGSGMLLTAATKPDAPRQWRDASGLLVMNEAPSQVLPEGLRDPYALAGRMGEENRTDFGYPRVEDGHVLLPVVSERAQAILGKDGDELVAALKTLEKERDAAPSDPKLQQDKMLELDGQDVVAAFLSGVILPIAGTSTYGDTIDARSAIFRRAASKEFYSADAWMAEFDAHSGHMLIYMSTLTPDVAAMLVQQDSPVPIEVVEEPNEPSAPAVGGRLNDSNPFYGGAEITGLHNDPNHFNGACSTGFAWNHAAAGTYPMTTAGHCAPWGDSAITTPAPTTIGSITNGSGENYDYGVGSVVLTGGTMLRGDIAWIHMNSTYVSQSDIYRAGPSSSTHSTVAEIWNRRALPGDFLCIGGVTTGEQCGWEVTDAGVPHTYANHDVVEPIVIAKRTGLCVDLGDSGGPVFTIRPDNKIAAKGLVSGGTLIGGSGSCQLFFTDIYDPIQAFAGTVRLG